MSNTDERGPVQGRQEPQATSSLRGQGAGGSGPGREEPVQTARQQGDRAAERPRAVSAAPIGPRLRLELGDDECDERKVVRFGGHQRAQHFIMMASVLILVFTGMPQKFFDSPVSLWLVDFWGGLDNARTIHHMAGFAMIFSALYHVAYLLYTIIAMKRPVPLWMLPSAKDFRDFLQNTGYYLGINKQKAQFGRFSYFEKFDYWAVFWGVPVMGLTGLILMFPLFVTRILPGVTIPVATIAHSDEAILATGWIFVVHFYNAHLAPHIFPFNRSIFTGRVGESRYRKEHPLEYKQNIAAQEG